MNGKKQASAYGYWLGNRRRNVFCCLNNNHICNYYSLDIAADRKKFASRFKQKSLKIITSDKDKSVEVVNNVLQINNIDLAACHIDKAENEFTVSFKFKSSDKPELTHLIKKFQSDTAIKEIVWSS